MDQQFLFSSQRALANWRQTPSQYDNATQVQNTYTDGFDLQLTNRPNIPYSYSSMCIDTTRLIRDPGLFIPKLYTVPENERVSVPAFSTLKEQVKIFTGSWVWAFKFTVMNPPDPFITALDFMVQIESSSNNGEITGKFEGASSYVNGVVQSSVSMLPSPIQIGDQGLLNVGLSNRTDQNVNIQFLILASVPIVPQDFVAYRNPQGDVLVNG